MDNKTRIEKEARERYAPHFVEQIHSYIAGATAEQERSYNKGWNDAIDKAISIARCEDFSAGIVIALKSFKLIDQPDKNKKL